MANHKQRKHALLSASGASRWMACTPSARLEEQFPESTSDYAKEGTLAHEFADVALRFFNGEITAGRLDEIEAKLIKSEFYSKEMPGQVAKYTDYVQERYNLALKESAEAFMEVEQKVDFSKYVEDGFGTGDNMIVRTGHLEMIDLKYGKGIQVSAENNPQLMLYGLGALAKHKRKYKIKLVTLTIHQPRLDAISSWTISVKELEKWGEKTVKPTAGMAFAGEGHQIPGDHCRFCRAKHACRALKELTDELAAHEFEKPMLLSDREILEAYKSHKIVTDWLKTVAEHVKKEALKGKEWPGYKLVTGPSKRSFIETDLLEDVLLSKGYPKQSIITEKLKGIGDISNLMSVDEFEELSVDWVIKPEGGPILVPLTDPRPKYGEDQAAADFAD